MSYIRALFAIAALYLAFGVAAGDLDPEKDHAIRQILTEFWGNARDVRGNPIQPSSRKDRETVPISRAAAYRALEAGNLSGLAQWCGLDWEAHYFALTKAARSMGMVDKQVAFVSVLHGVGQGGMVKSRANELCSHQQRARVTALVLDSQQLGLPADAKAGW